MKAVEAIYILNMFKESCEKEHMDTEAEALNMAIQVLNFWDLNVKYILDLEKGEQPSTQPDHFREVTKKPEQNVYVVTYQDGDEEPVLSVFNNERAAVAYRDEEGKNHDRIWLDEAPIFSKTLVDGRWVG